MRLFCKGAVAVAAATMMATVVAAPLGELYFQQVAGWVNPTTDATTETGFFGGPLGLTLSLNTPLVSPPASTNTFAQMAWTSTLNQATSSLTINSYTSASSPSAGPDANGLWNAGEWWRIDRLVQSNQVLSVNGNVANPNPLWVADILGNFRVFSDAGLSSLLVADLDAPTRIKYWETTNTQTAQGCTSPNPLGSACDDIYTVLAISLAPVQFSYLGFLYTVEFRIEPGDNTLVCDGSSSVGPCSTESGAQPGPGELLKVYAREGQNSELFVAARWSAREIPVPEPSSLALVGLSLAGLGVAARRRRASSN